MISLRTVASKLSKIFRPFLPPHFRLFSIGVAKVRALFISPKIFLIFFEVFFFDRTRNYLKNFRFFRADGKDTIVLLHHQFFVCVSYSQPLHSESTL